MKRIGTSDGRFVDGSRRVPGTPVSADWLNGMQEAIAQVLEHYDGQVDPENDRQLLDVLRHQVAARFESIAALRAFGGGRAGQAVDVAGYYAGRPGSGSGVFVALGADKTRADNGGTIIVDAAGMRWMRLGKTFDLYDFGASGNGSADDTDAVERALAHAAATGSEMMVPAGVFRLTRKIAIHQGMRIKGCGYREKDAGGAEKLTGSWLFFDHADKGIEFDGDAGYFTGAELCDFGIVRPQPTPVDGVEWTPADAQWDIYFHAMASATVSNVMHLRSTRGIYAGGNVDGNKGTGRVDIYRSRGCWFKQGIEIDHCYDVLRIDQLHAWPFWLDHAEIHKYMLQHLDVITLRRCDNPLLSNIFTIFARAGLRFTKSSAGSTAKFHLSNADFDRGHLGVWVDASNNNGITGQAVNYSCQGETDSGNGILVESTNSSMVFSAAHIKYPGGAAIKIGGAGNHLSVSGLLVEEYSKGGSNSPAIDVADNNRINIIGRPEITKQGGNNGGKYSYTGFISVDDWRSYTPAVQGDGGVALDSVVSDCLYKLTGTTVSVRLDLTVQENGNAEGNLQVKRPPYLSAGVWTGAGREIKKSGKAVTLTLENAWDYILINNFDNTYPVSNGTRVVGTINYAI